MEQLSGIGKLRLKLASDLFADFIAALVNPGANRHPDVLRPAPEPAAHFANPFLDDPFDRPPPTSVKDPDRTPFCIYQNHRQTIGSLNREQHSRSVRNQSIADQGMFRRAAHPVYQIRMYLAQGDERPQLIRIACSPNGPDERFPVPLDISSRVPFRKSQIQSIPAIQFRDSAHARAEAVHEPGNSLQRIRSQDI